MLAGRAIIAPIIGRGRTPCRAQNAILLIMGTPTPNFGKPPSSAPNPNHRLPPISVVAQPGLSLYKGRPRSRPIKVPRQSEKARKALK